MQPYRSAKIAAAITTKMVTRHAAGGNHMPEPQVTYPEIPSWLVDPIVFRDKNLGIAMVAHVRIAGTTELEQWIYRSHNGHWCSVRKVDERDPMFMLEKLNP
jgi:hypothetical protein